VQGGGGAPCQPRLAGTACCHGLGVLGQQRGFPKTALRLPNRSKVSGRVWSPDSVRRTSAAFCMQAFFFARSMLYGGRCAGCFRARRVPDIPVDQPAYHPPPIRLVTNVAGSIYVRSSTMVKPTPDPPIVHLSSSLRYSIALPSARRPSVILALAASCWVPPGIASKAHARWRMRCSSTICRRERCNSTNPRWTGPGYVRLNACADDTARAAATGGGDDWGIYAHRVAMHSLRYNPRLSPPAALDGRPRIYFRSKRLDPWH
jgi:hypothetical protein